MGHKKGFTLVELLAVIVILGLILAIAVPRIMDLIDNTRESAYQINEGMMISAARNYLVMDESKNPSKKGTINIITIEELQNSELISSINDAQDSNIECDGYVVVKNVDNITFDYMPYLKCGNNYETEGYVTQSVQSIEVLVVAGGGSGGSNNGFSSTGGGGGGAGGVKYVESVDVEYGQQYPVIVGAGGDSQDAHDRGNKGEDSAALGYTAIGGGGGGGNGGGTLGHGEAGGSGGGARGWSANTNFNPGSGVLGQGHDGGFGLLDNNGPGGGGGGAGGPGGNFDDAGGAGGEGLYFGNLFSESYGDEGWFAGGGGGSGGSGGSLGGSGGSGGGGNGANHNVANAESGTENTGGGGGANGTASAGVSGGGGSGIVLIKYYGSQKANGGTITTFNGYTIHAFTEVGESVFELLEF